MTAAVRAKGNIAQAHPRYAALECIGRGGTGEVHGGYDRQTGRRVALKSLRWVPQAHDDSAALTLVVEEGQRATSSSLASASRAIRPGPGGISLRDEARVLASLSHPNIVQAYDYIEDHNEGLLVLERVDGLSLRQLIKRGPIRPLVALHIAIQVADALAHVHSRGLVHADLKPGNILLTTVDDDPHFVKLIDFGLSIQPHCESNRFMGTARYAAPEQILGTPERRSDLYALGVVLFHMLAGHGPYERAEPIDTLRAHLYAPIPSVIEACSEVELSPAIEWVIRSCMHKDVEHRFSTAAIMKRALLLAAEDQLVREQRNSWPSGVFVR